MLTLRVFRLSAFLGVAVLVGGCSNGTMESTVSGTVTLDGTAIGPGVVVFAPIDGKRNPATGTIDTKGSYSLVTSRTDGLIAGKYQVSVSVRELLSNVRPGDRPAPGKLLTPSRYESSTTSGLVFDVGYGGNTIDLELTSH